MGIATKRCTDCVGGGRCGHDIEVIECGGLGRVSVSLHGCISKVEEAEEGKPKVLGKQGLEMWPHLDGGRKTETRPALLPMMGRVGYPCLDKTNDSRSDSTRKDSGDMSRGEQLKAVSSLSVLAGDCGAVVLAVLHDASALGMVLLVALMCCPLTGSSSLQPTSEGCAHPEEQAHVKSLVLLFTCLPLGLEHPLQRSSPKTHASRSATSFIAFAAKDLRAAVVHKSLP